MADRIRKQWEELGASDPYWAVLTDPTKQGGKWDKAQFLQTGVDEIADVERQLASLGITPKLAGVALDYGCGVGRLTRALAARFSRVIGVDISQPMLDEAHANTSELGNVELIRGSGRDLRSVSDHSVDFIYSNIALQHSPADMQRGVVREMTRVLAPGGVLVFQTPSHGNLRDWRGVVHRVLGDRLTNRLRAVLYGKRHVMEVHALARQEVLAILGDAGLSVRTTSRNHAAGSVFVSYQYVAVKP